MSNTLNIDEEWDKFITSSNNEEYDEDDIYDDQYNHSLLNDEQPKQYCDKSLNDRSLNDVNEVAPEATDIYISTKTKIAYLNTVVDLNKIFWLIDVMKYTTPMNGVVKKQMKFNSNLEEEVEYINHMLKNEPYYEEYIITHINNPTGRIKFKDVRKISIGISKKDIMTYRCKQKSAFYNCFVIILRMKVNSLYKEFHVKVFNTGKIEIPGVQNDDIFEPILKEVVNILQPHMDIKIDYQSDNNETVLVNSNFNCGFFINREILHDILKYKYNIQVMLDSCNYPGIQCKFYYNPDCGIQTGCQISDEDKKKYKNISEISFMIFRTGSVLIIGKCDKTVLNIIYEYLKNMLKTEYSNILQKGSALDIIAMKKKIKKIRKKTVTITVNA